MMGPLLDSWIQTKSYALFTSFQHFIGVVSPPSTFLDPQLLAVLTTLFMIGSYIILECMSFIYLLYNRLLMLFRFADRDLMMRFRGGGVGHKSTRQATDFFKKDRHASDLQKSTLEEPEEMNNSESEESGKMERSSESDVDDEEDDYGYHLGEDESGSEEEEKSEEELGDGDLGPEDDGRATVDSDMEELGYAEL
jgi:hypothetical protein